MNNNPNNTDDAAQKAKVARMLRIIWIILIAVFAVVIIFHLYGWSQGRETLRSILSPLGLIFAGAGALVRPRNRMLSFILTGIALFLVFTALVLMIIY